MTKDISASKNLLYVSNFQKNKCSKGRSLTKVQMRVGRTHSTNNSCNHITKNSYKKTKKCHTGWRGDGQLQNRASWVTSEAKVLLKISKNQEILIRIGITKMCLTSELNRQSCHEKHPQHEQKMCNRTCKWQTATEKSKQQEPISNNR